VECGCDYVRVSGTWRLSGFSVDLVLIRGHADGADCGGEIEREERLAHCGVEVYENESENESKIQSVTSRCRRSKRSRS